MALIFDQIKQGQTSAPPKFDQQGMLINNGQNTPTVVYDPTQWGIDPSIWQALGPSGQAFIESATGILQSQQNNGNFQAAVNHDLFNQALQSAQTDPNILAKYGDAAKIDVQNLTQNLDLITGTYDQTVAKQQRDYVQAQKDLAEQAAEAGQAYSGYREQAKQKLALDQNDIVQSSRRQLQQNLQQQFGTYEQKYGTNALQMLNQPLTVGAGDSAASYSPYGGITGTQPLQKKQDIFNQGVQNYNMEKL